MLREIITPTTQDFTIHIPAEYLHTQVEILVLPLSDKQGQAKKEPDNIINKTSGLLAKRAIDPLEWQKKIRSEWDERL